MHDNHGEVPQGNGPEFFMVKVFIGDGQPRIVKIRRGKPVTVREVFQRVGLDVAGKDLSAAVDCQMVSLDTIITHDCQLQVVSHDVNGEI